MSREDFADSLRTERHERRTECADGITRGDDFLVCTEDEGHDGQHYDDFNGEGWGA